MKSKLFLCLLMIIALSFPVYTSAEPETPVHFNENQQIAFETIKWNIDFPKNAQIKQVTEYLCKVEEFQLHLLLIEATQNEHIEMMFGKSACIVLVDLDTKETITFSNFVWPETSDINNKEDALNMLFSCYLSYLEGYNPLIFADHEITYPMTEEEIASINAELIHYFIR